MLLPIAETVSLSNFAQTINLISEQPLTLSILNEWLKSSVLKVYFKNAWVSKIEGINRSKEYLYPVLRSINTDLDSNYLHDPFKAQIYDKIFDCEDQEAINHLGEFCLIPEKEYQISEIIDSFQNEEDFSCLPIKTIKINDSIFPIFRKQYVAEYQEEKAYTTTEPYLYGEDVKQFIKAYFHKDIPLANEEKRRLEKYQPAAHQPANAPTLEELYPYFKNKDARADNKAYIKPVLEAFIREHKRKPFSELELWPHLIDRVKNLTHIQITNEGRKIIGFGNNPTQGYEPIALKKTLEERWNKE